ncbi:MAG TPA: glycosyltransferase family 39 protein [Candidatus Omnitrophota bacterium]|nr:glycosyltransferase family 39 protein [Candidatus Omnitrophota bacterium]
MIDILIFCLLVWLILGMGKAFLDFLKLQCHSVLEECVLSFGLGAGALALMVLTIGLFGFLFKGVLLAMLVLLSIVFLRGIAQMRRNIFETLKDFIRSSFSTFERFLIITVLFVAMLTLIGSLSPVMGMDAAAYHMQDVKIFIQQHRIILIPFTRESLWPFLIQMLFALGLCLKGVVLAKLFHFAYYGASFFAIYLLCRRYWPRPNSLLAASIFAITPAIFTGTTYAYTDLAVVFYTVLAFYGFFTWLDTNQTRWFCLSGIMAGFLLGIKITSAVVPAIILALYLHKILFSRIGFKQKTLPVMVFILAMMACCGVWYVRSWLILGNPIFPFAGSLFNGNGYPKDYTQGFHAFAGIGLGWKQYVSMLWFLTLNPARFGGESIGLVFLLFLPMLVFVRNVPKFVRYVFVIAWALYTSWFFVYQYTRFFYPTLFFLCILASFVYYDFCFKDHFLRKLGTLLLIGCFGYSAALAIYHHAEKFPVVFGLTAQREYLMKHERSFGIADYVNTHIPKDAKVLIVAEPRLYYFDREVAMADLIQLDLLSKKQASGRTLDDFMCSNGYCNYMVVMRDLSRNKPLAPSLTAKDYFKGYDKNLLKTVEFTYRDERYLYELWKINGNIGEHP